jgi:hypothetical protein
VSGLGLTVAPLDHADIMVASEMKRGHPYIRPDLYDSAQVEIYKLMQTGEWLPPPATAAAAAAAAAAARSDTRRWWGRADSFPRFQSSRPYENFIKSREMSNLQNTMVRVMTDQQV